MDDQNIALLKTSRTSTSGEDERARVSLPSTSQKAAGVKRIQDNILAVPERKLLNWLCAHLPRAVMPDHLTALGFAGTVLTVAGYALSGDNAAWLFAAIAGFFINWFGDSLDGSLARYRHIERPAFGYFIDHSLDAVGNLLTMIGFGLSPYVRMDVALLAASAYLLLSAHTFLAARVTSTFRLSYGPMGPTELRLILIGLTIAMWFIGPTKFCAEKYSLFDVFTCGASMLLLSIFVKQTYMLARTLLIADNLDIPVS
jgi:archaetidylinositol phosphate synthase